MIEKLKWFLWRRVRRTWLIGVYTVVFDMECRVLLVYKRLGLSTGWQIPGGGKPRWVSFPEQAKKELWEEAGITSDLKLVGISSNEKHIDAYMIYAGYVKGGTELCPRDRIEISKAKYFPIDQAKKILPEDQRRMLQMAIVQLPLDTYM